MREKGRGKEANLPISVECTNRFHESLLRLGPEKLDFIVDHDLGDSGHTVALGHVGELADLHDIGDDPVALDCHLMGHTGHAGTVRSRRCDKDLNMHVL